MFIDPTAARELPQSEGARILAMGKSGIALLNGTTPEFPFAAYAQQHLPNVAPSLNTRMMEQAIGKYADEGKSDPRVENSLHKMVSNDILPDAYAIAEKYPHDFANVLNGYVRTPEQEKDYLKLKEKTDAVQTLRDNSLLLPEFLKKLDGDTQKNGLVISPELQKSISDYYQYMDNTIGKGGMEEDAIKEQKQLLDKLHGYTALDEMVKKVLPAKDAVLKGTDVAPATYTDKNGKQVQIADTFAENNYDNPNTTELKADLTKRADLILSGADDDEKSAIAKQLGSKKDDESVRNGLVNYMYSILPKGGSTTLHSEGRTNVYVNNAPPVQEGSVYQTEGTQFTIGAGDKATKITPLATYATPSVKVDLGKIDNIVNQETGDIGTVDLTGATAGAPQLMRTKYVNGAFVPTNETEGNIFDMPMVAVSKPATGEKYKRDSDGSLILDEHKNPIPDGEYKTGETLNYLVPASRIYSASPEYNAAVTESLADARAKNSTKSTSEQARKYFEQGASRIETKIYKQKKTGEVTEKQSTETPGFNTPLQ